MHNLVGRVESGSINHIASAKRVFFSHPFVSVSIFALSLVAFALESILMPFMNDEGIRRPQKPA